MKNIFHIYRYLIRIKNENIESSNNGLMEIFIPPILLSTMIILSTFSQLATIIFTILSIPSILFLFNNYIYYDQMKKYRTNFFISWSISSFLIQLFVFEMIVVPFLEITIWENYTLLSLITIVIIIVIYLRKQSSSNNQDDNTTVKNNNRYCCWIGTTINRLIDYYLFILGHLCLICALLFNIYLNITTICHTYSILNDTILIPDDCSEVYFDINLSLSFITAIYAAQLVILLLYSMLKLLWFIFRLSSMKKSQNSCSYHLLK